MKKPLLLIITSLVLVSCNKPGDDEINDTTLVPGSVLTENDIGPSGGIIEADGISVTIPPGTFITSSRVQILMGEESSNVFGNNTVTGLYVIDGIPEDFAKPIEIRLAYTGTLANDHYLVVGTEPEILESEENMFSCALYEATDSSGTLVSYIEPPATSGSSEAGTKKSTKSVFAKLILMAITNMTSHETPFFRFDFQYQADRARIVKFSTYLDAAIDTFAAMNLINKTFVEAACKEFGKPSVTIWGLSNEGYLSWSIEMPDFQMRTQDIPPSYGVVIWKSLLQIKLNVPERVLRDASEKEMAALAFLLVYRLSCFINVGSLQNWFIYGSTYWIMEKNTGEVTYDVTGSPEFAMSPLRGMESGKTIFEDTNPVKSVMGGTVTSQMATYGMSMIPLIKYLDQTYGQNGKLILSILSKTLYSASKIPTEAIIEAIDDPEYIWLPGFYKAYLTRALYPISFDHFLDKIHSLDQLDIYREADTTMYNDAEYADLSARLYKANFLMPEFKEEASLNFKLGPPSLNLNYVTTMAFGLKNSELEYFDHAPDLTITKLAELTQNDYHSIVALVVNSANEPPFNESLTIELDTKLRIAPKDFDWVIVKVKARAKYTYNDGTSSEGSYIYADGDIRAGGMTGNKFTATWSEPFSSGTSSGAIDIFFDLDRYPNYISGYSVTETRTLSDKRTYTITGEDLEFIGSRDYTGTYSYYVTGEETKNYITSLNEVYTGSGDYGYSTDGIPITDESSYIEIRMGRFE